MKMRELKNGMTIWNHGHQFVVSDVRDVGNDVIRYTGTCNNHKSNDSIRRTSYNGGTYGGIGRLDVTPVLD
jgi:hypothetical protein